MFRMFKAEPNEKEEVSKIEDSTSKMSEEVLGKGGPPAVPLMVVRRIRIYDGNEEIKVDKNGDSYIGMSIDELLLAEQKEYEDKLLEKDANQDSQITNWRCPCNIL